MLWVRFALAGGGLSVTRSWRDRTVSVSLSLFCLSLLLSPSLPVSTLRVRSLLFFVDASVESVIVSLCSFKIELPVNSFSAASVLFFWCGGGQVRVELQ